jgi:fucose permease
MEVCKSNYPPPRYVTTTLGWLTYAHRKLAPATAVSPYLLGMPSVLNRSFNFIIGADVTHQRPPFWLYVLSFYVGGTGMALQDAQANTFNANLPNAHMLLGILHGMYGFGATISPIVATIIANSTPDFRRWHYFYYISAGLAVINSCFISYAFRDTIWPPLFRKLSKMRKEPALTDTVAPRHDRRDRKQANKDFIAILKRKEVWLLAAYFFVYVGTEVTIAGWVVEFMIEVRHGKPSQVGSV